jgi:thiamine biosynthesis lipoprotein
MAAGARGLARGSAGGLADGAAGTVGRAGAVPWRRVATGDDAVAVAERGALGTSARVVVWPPGNLGLACAAADDVLAGLDRQASRFRPDSELSWLHAAGGGTFLLSDGLAEAVGVALAAARWTGGLTDPTVGDALVSLGYDRDFAAIGEDGGIAAATGGDGTPPGAAVAAPGWQLVRLDGPLLRIPPGIRLDLGATAKGLGSDRAVRAALAAAGGQGGVLISLGGDIAVGGTPPQDGWPVTVAEEPGQAGQLVRLAAGAVATSSVTVRRWRRGGAEVHHIVDPWTGRPADGPWRTATVAAATCADANAASTAAIVAGVAAEDWLATAGLPARLTSHDGRVRGLNGWPGPEAGTWAPVPTAAGSHVYAAGPAVRPGTRAPGGGR